jgi:hypothetical protein
MIALSKTYPPLVTSAGEPAAAAAARSPGGRTGIPKRCFATRSAGEVTATSLGPLLDPAAVREQLLPQRRRATLAGRGRDDAGVGVVGPPPG